MDKSVYENYRTQEEAHWWFVGRKKILTAVLGQKIVPSHNDRALDIGCGTGFLTSLVSKMSNSVYCVEMANEMIDALRNNIKNAHIIKGYWPDVDIDQTFSLVTLFDSLEHIEDDKKALRKIESVLEPGGVVVITVPAYQFLWSEHDVVNQHFRRYSKKLMEDTIRENTELTILQLSYFNTIFFIPIATIRLLKNVFGIQTKVSDIISLPPIINSVCAWLFGIERKFLPWMNLPFGTSLLCIAQKGPSSKNKSQLSNQ